MSRGWWNSLWIVLVCWSLACSKPSDTPATGKSEDGVGNSTAKAGGSGAKLLPPEPDDESGTARASDKSKGSKPPRLTADSDDPFKDAAANETSPVDKGPARTSLAGKWILILTRPSENGFADFHTGIVEVTAAKGDDAEAALKAEWNSQSAVLPPATLKKFEVATQQIHLEFDVGDTTLDFRGKLKNGVVMGNALYGNCLPARLIPTKEESLEGFKVDPEPADARLLGQAFAAQDPQVALKGLKKFVADRPDSPLGMMAWESLIMITAMTGGEADAVEGMINDYHSAMGPWGVRLQQTAKGNVAMVLAQTKYDPEFSLKYLSATDKLITDESLKDLKDQLKNARESIQTAQALTNIESEDEEVAKKAFDLLSKLRQKSPFDPSVLYGLAQYQENAKQADAAMELYAEIASLPMLETFLQQSWGQKKGATKRPLPSELLTKLWAKKNADGEGLDEYKDSIYRKRLVSFAAPASSDPAPTNRVVLCELFTGSSCPPCVGADVATSGLEVSYPKSQVIVIRYHQHIPGPDPMTNADGEERFSSYYRGQGTPAVYLNGAPINGVGGYLPNSPEIYKGLKKLVDQQLAKKADVKVRLVAKIDGDKLVLKSDVQGLDQVKEDEVKDLRLRIVIAEDEVHFLARNGVRSHEMIVRRMIGGPEGTAITDGKVAVSESIPLADLKDSLADYLKKYEESEGIDFPAKPLDLKRFHIVAFLQNDESHEVLQTIAVPVGVANSTASSEITPAAGNAPAKTSVKKVTPVN